MTFDGPTHPEFSPVVDSVVQTEPSRQMTREEFVEQRARLLAVLSRGGQVIFNLADNPLGLPRQAEGDQRGRSD